MPDGGQVVVLLLFMLLGTVLANIVVLLLNLLPGAGALQTYMMLISYPIMFIPAMIYSANKSRNNEMFQNGIPVDRNNFGSLGGIALGVMTIIATLAASVLTEPLQMLLPQTPEWFENVMKQMLNDTPLWASFLSVSILAPVFEEWLCRGMILRGLLLRMKPLWAMVVSALIFGLIHMNPWQALPAFCLGMLFAYVYYRTGSLKLTMLMHFANNTFALIASNIDSMKDIDFLADILSTWEYAVLIAAALFLLVLFIRIIRRTVPLPQESVSEAKE